MKKLLIYIPTYNRYELLVKQLSGLLGAIEQYNIQNVRVVVSDNASMDGRYLKLKGLFPHDVLEVRRNEVNIGLVGNLIRGFEQPDWDYIWLLSDDDEVKYDALAGLAEEISLGEHDFYYLKSNVKGDACVSAGDVIVDQHDYFSRFSAFSMMGLISINIYSARTKKYLESMYLYGYTLFPFLGGVFKLTGAEKFSLKVIGGEIVRWQPNKISYAHIFDMALSNVLFLAELIPDQKNRRVFLWKYMRDFGATHYFPIAIRSVFNFRKALAQVGMIRLLYSGILYTGVMLYRGLVLLFPATGGWLKQYRKSRIAKT